MLIFTLNIDFIYSSIEFIGTHLYEHKEFTYVSKVPIRIKDVYDFINIIF